MNSRSKLPWVIGLLIYSVAMSLLPYALRNCDIKLDSTVVYYPWNFTPLTVACLLSGACVTDRRLAFILPLAGMFLADIGIGFLTGHWDWAFPPNTWWMKYFSYTGAIALGLFLRNGTGKPSLGRAVGFGLGFEIAFYAVSNFIYWACEFAGPHTWSTLGKCYVDALPFFRNAPLSTLLFSLLVFGPLGVFATREATSRDLVPASAR